MNNNDFSRFLHPSWHQHGSKFGHVGPELAQVSSKSAASQPKLTPSQPRLAPGRLHVAFGRCLVGSMGRPWPLQVGSGWPGQVGTHRNSLEIIGNQPESSERNPIGLSICQAKCVALLYLSIDVFVDISIYPSLLSLIHI